MSEGGGRVGGGAAGRGGGARTWSIFQAETTRMPAKRRSIGRKRWMTPMPSAIMKPRRTRAEMIPHLSTRCWYASGTLKYSKSIRKTKRLSTESDFSTRNPVKKSIVPPRPFIGYTTPRPKARVTTNDQIVVVIAWLVLGCWYPLASPDATSCACRLKPAPRRTFIWPGIGGDACQPSSGCSGASGSSGSGTSTKLPPRAPKEFLRELRAGRLSPADTAHESSMATARTRSSRLRDRTKLIQLAVGQKPDASALPWRVDHEVAVRGGVLCRSRCRRWFARSEPSCKS